MRRWIVAVLEISCTCAWLLQNVACSSRKCDGQTEFAGLPVNSCRREHFGAFERRILLALCYSCVKTRAVFVAVTQGTWPARKPLSISLHREGSRSGLMSCKRARAARSAYFVPTPLASSTRCMAELRVLPTSAAADQARAHSACSTTMSSPRHRHVPTVEGTAEAAQSGTGAGDLFQEFPPSVWLLQPRHTRSRGSSMQALHPEDPRFAARMSRLAAFSDVCALLFLCLLSRSGMAFGSRTKPSACTLGPLTARLFFFPTPRLAMPSLRIVLKRRKIHVDSI